MDNLIHPYGPIYVADLVLQSISLEEKGNLRTICNYLLSDSSAKGSEVALILLIDQTIFFFLENPLFAMGPYRGV